MPFAEAIARDREADLTFELPPGLAAKEPAEVRGAGRDDVRLLVTSAHGNVHARFRQLPDFLAQGDLLVLNLSATIPAALTARREDGAFVQLHISTCLPAGLFIVEPRETSIEEHERLRLPGGALAKFLTPCRNSRRMWVARLSLPAPFLPYIMRYGQPVRYRHITARWPLETYQNVYATEPGSAEMPSAGRPFTPELLRRLRDRGVGIASIVLHAGVSSLERDEPPHEESYAVPTETAEAVRCARRNGGRVIAVGTTVVRALESSLETKGRVVASRGWTDVVVTPGRGVSAVDGLLTGFHEPNSSHLGMLEAIAGRDAVREAYRAALATGYLWHEFGDSHLILTNKPATLESNAGQSELYRHRLGSTCPVAHTA